MYFSSRDHYYCCACTICIRSTKYIGHWQKSLSDESCTCQFGAKSKFWTEKEKRGSVLARWECVSSAYMLAFPTKIQKTQFWFLTMLISMLFLSIYGIFYCFLLFYGENQPRQIKIFFHCSLLLSYTWSNYPINLS